MKLLSMPAKIIKVMTTALAAFVLLAIVAWAVSNKLDSSNFGKFVITLPDGARVYVIHEQWGLHEEEISVTLNPDGCLPPNPVTDFIDTFGSENSLVYS